LEAKQKEEKDLSFLAETKDMSDNDMIRLRKQREREALAASYVTMNSLELAVSKYADDLSEAVHMAIKAALHNKASIEDKFTHVRKVSAAAHCVLLQHLDLYINEDTSLGQEVVHTERFDMEQDDEQSLASALTVENEFNEDENRLSIASQDGLNNSSYPGCDDNFNAGNKSDDDEGAMCCAVELSGTPLMPASDGSLTTATPVLPPSVLSESTTSSGHKSEHDPEDKAGCGSELCEGEREAVCSNIEPTIQSLAFVTVNESLRCSIENVIKALITASSRDEIQSTSQMKECLVIDSNGDSPMSGVDGLSTSTRSIINSARGHMSVVENQMLDEAKQKAGELAESITANILTISQQQQDSPEVSMDAASVAVALSRALTPAILTEAIEAACCATLKHSPPQAQNTDDVAAAVAHALTESITSEVVSERLSAARTEDCSSPRHRHRHRHHDHPTGEGRSAAAPAVSEEPSVSSRGSLSTGTCLQGDQQKPAEDVIQREEEVPDSINPFVAHQYQIAIAPPVENISSSMTNADMNQVLDVQCDHLHAGGAEEEVPSVADLAADREYEDILLSTARGLRVSGENYRRRSTGG
jgi:hypothetical protein